MLIKGHGHCTHGETRLVDNTSRFEGGVEVCVDGVWGAICKDFWGANDARVVCRQLGFHVSGKLLQWSRYTTVVSYILAENIQVLKSTWI